MVRNKIDNGININIIRKQIVNAIFKIEKTYSEEYGEIVLAYDSKDSWRKTEYPFYKQNRKRERNNSKFDWDMIFSAINKIRDEIRSNLPFKVLDVKGAEADDIIATLCINKYKTQSDEPVLILSADKDFIQLQVLSFVKQYDMIRKKWITHESPNKFLKEHIICGDRSDGIPNILTADNTLAEGKPQKMISKEYIQELASLTPDQFDDKIKLRNWRRNSHLIDFRQIPKSISDKILIEYRYPPLRSEISEDYLTQFNIIEEN